MPIENTSLNRITHFIRRTGGRKVRFVVDGRTGNFQLPNNKLVAGKIQDGRLTWFGGAEDEKTRGKLELIASALHPNHRIVNMEKLRPAFIEFMTLFDRQNKSDENTYRPHPSEFIEHHLKEFFWICPGLAREKNQDVLEALLRLPVRLNDLNRAREAYQAIFTLLRIEPSLAASGGLIIFIDFFADIAANTPIIPEKGDPEEIGDQYSDHIDLVTTLINSNPALTDPRNIEHLKRCTGILITLLNEASHVRHPVKTLLTQHNYFAQLRCFDIFNILINTIIKCSAKGFCAETLVERCVSPFMNERPELLLPRNHGELNAFCSTISALLDNGICPTPHLVQCVHENKTSIEALKLRTWQIQKEGFGTLSLEDQTDIDLYYSMVARLAGPDNNISNYKTFKIAIEKFKMWQHAFPEYFTIHNDIPAFTVSLNYVSPPQRYSIVPAGISALFRGYIGNDHTIEEDFPLWALNNNNMYFFIKKGDRTLSYISITKCVTPDGKKVLLIDRMRGCPPGTAIPIINILADMARERGYSGIAIEEKYMNNTFDNKVTTEEMLDSRAFKEGVEVDLAPLDQTSWKEFEALFGEYTYHPLNANYWKKRKKLYSLEISNYILLKSHKEPGKHIEPGREPDNPQRKAFIEFIQKLRAANLDTKTVVEHFLVPLFTHEPAMKQPENIQKLDALIGSLHKYSKVIGMDHDDLKDLFKSYFVPLMESYPSLMKPENIDNLIFIIKMEIELTCITTRPVHRAARNEGERTLSKWLLSAYPQIAFASDLGTLQKICDALFENEKKLFEMGFKFEDLLEFCVKNSILEDQIARNKDCSALLSKFKIMNELILKGIFPSPEMMKQVSEGTLTIADILARFDRLSKLRGDFISEIDDVDCALFFTVLARKFGVEMDISDYNWRIRSVLDSMKEWIATHKDNTTLETEFPPFTVTGKGEVLVKEDVFDGKLIDEHFTRLSLDVSKYGMSTLIFPEDCPFSEPERRKFLQRVLAHCQLMEAKEKGKLPNDFKVTNRVLRAHVARHNKVFEVPDSALRDNIGKYTYFDKIGPAVYLTTLGELFNAILTKQQKKSVYLKTMLMHVLLNYGMMDRLLFSEAGTHQAGYMRRLEALRQIYADRTMHLPDITNSPVPPEVQRMIDERFSQLKEEYQKLGLAFRQANTQEYTIAPAGMAALFRGIIGKDCSFDGNIPIWAFNPNNQYMLLKKGDKIKGYIGMTKCKTPEGEKVLLIDTMQPCPPGLVEPILTTLAKLAKEKGYIGLALGAKLGGSFNYHETIEAVESLPAYRNGKKVKLTPEDMESWDAYEMVLQRDSCHTLNLNSSLVDRKDDGIYEETGSALFHDFVLLRI